jgi:hypothetical protein
METASSSITTPTAILNRASDAPLTGAPSSETSFPPGAASARGFCACERAGNSPDTTAVPLVWADVFFADFFIQLQGQRVLRAERLRLGSGIIRHAWMSEHPPEQDVYDNSTNNHKTLTHNDIREHQEQSPVTRHS